MDLKLLKQILDKETDIETCGCIKINGCWIFFDDYRIIHYQDDNSENFRVELILDDKLVYIIYSDDIKNIRLL